MEDDKWYCDIRDRLGNPWRFELALQPLGFEFAAEFQAAARRSHWTSLGSVRAESIKGSQ
jgi:hypothetical protein